MLRAKVLEIACFNVESAMISETCGADRIELCENYREGGLTPSKEIILEVRKKLSIPVHVIIRPRGNNFIYSRKEIELMKESILFCKENKIDGVVFGVLDIENNIDVPVCKILFDLAKPMSVVFHRAIDRCRDLNTAIESLIDLGVQSILTSAGEDTAEKGVNKLKVLQDSYGDKIIIMPGGGIRAKNLKTILSSGCDEYHSSALNSVSEIADAAEIKRLKQLLNEAC